MSSIDSALNGWMPEGLGALRRYFRAMDYMQLDV